MKSGPRNQIPMFVPDVGNRHIMESIEKITAHPLIQLLEIIQRGYIRDQDGLLNVKGAEMIKRREIWISPMLFHRKNFISLKVK
jgi:hypothetical protein